MDDIEFWTRRLGLGLFFELGSSHKAWHKIESEGTLESQQPRWTGNHASKIISPYKCGGWEVGMAAR